MALETRVLANIQRDENTNCWQWTGMQRNGYGRLLVGKKLHTAHRVAYEQWVGPIPAGMSLHHMCRNRGCVNPSHLEPVSLQENLMRMVRQLAAVPCAYCGTTITPKHPRGQFCSAKCRKAAWQRKRQDREARLRERVKGLVKDLGLRPDDFS